MNADWTALFNLIVGLMPLIQQIVEWIEKTIGAGQGPKKKQIVFDQILSMIPLEMAKSNRVRNAISTQIDNTVTSLNKAGFFKHTILAKVDPDQMNLFGA